MVLTLLSIGVNEMIPKIKVDVGRGRDPVELQQLIDTDLLTRRKTVVGAINELLGKIEELESNADSVDVSSINNAIAALQNQLKDIDGGEGNVKKYIDDAIAALNIGQYEQAIADLATIAKTGNVADLVQTDGDVLILDCGTAI